MKSYSAAYANAMKKLTRNRSYARVTFQEIDTGAGSDGTWVDNGHVIYSENETLDNLDYTFPNTYATLETNRFVLDGSQILLPDSNFVQTGYTSSFFDTGAQLTRIFSESRTLTGMTFYFDTHAKDYPSNMTIEYWNGDSMVASYTIYPKDTVYELEEPVESVDKVIITINDMNVSGRRPRIEKIIWGIVKVFSGDQLASITQSTDVDPISRRLPKENMKWVIFDLEQEYDPDNPQGIWNFLDVRSPIMVEFGYELDDGTIEWLAPVRFVLDGKPEVEDRKASFTCTGLITSMENMYYKDTYETKTLYEMAQSVLEDAGLPLTGDLENPWVIDNSLQDISTNGILPILTHKEALQVIAHAGMCKIYTDDNNVIHIEKMEIPSQPLDFSIENFDTYGEPKATKIEPLYAINVLKYSHSPYESSSELHKSTFTVNGTIDFHAEFSPATNISISVSGGTASNQNIYAQAVDMQITANGSVTVTITGYNLNESTSGIPMTVSADNSGETEVVENPLVTEESHRSALATYLANYLQLRNSYEVNYRGNPELETGDLIEFQTPFTPQINALVLKHDLKFNGALSGSLIVKKVNQ